MSITLRIFLIVCSMFSLFLCVKKIKQSKLKMENSIVWILGSLLLIIMSLFTNFVEWIAIKIGFQAPVNFVFLVIIAFLLIQLFLTDIHITELNEKIKDLDHYIALKENEDKRNGERK